MAIHPRRGIAAGFNPQRSISSNHPPFKLHRRPSAPHLRHLRYSVPFCAHLCLPCLPCRLWTIHPRSATIPCDLLEDGAGCHLRRQRAHGHPPQAGRTPAAIRILPRKEYSMETRMAVRTPRPPLESCGFQLAEHPHHQPGDVHLRLIAVGWQLSAPSPCS